MNHTLFNILPLSLIFVGNLSGQSPLQDPIPAAELSPLSIVIEPYLQLPKTASGVIEARLSMLKAAPGDVPSAFYVNDANGPLYRIENQQIQMVTDLSDVFPQFRDSPGLGAGFQSFAFHPEYAENGRFYTVHTEFTSGGTAHFSSPSDYTPHNHGIVTEWVADQPFAAPFSGTRRELLRISFSHQIHGIQEVAFNPNATPGHSDYGMLYTTVGDGGSFNVSRPQDLQRPDTLYGTVLRVDPDGDNGLSGEYGIPSDNPWQPGNSEGYFPEIYALGFRNPHRIVFQPVEFAEGEPLIFINDIGERNAEEVNLLGAGGNYGWPEREGTFLFRGDNVSLRDNVYPLPANDESFGFTYPVAQYGHNTARAIGAGVFYYGNEIPYLQGHYIFNDIPDGEIFHFDLAELGAAEWPTIYELAERVNNRPRILKARYGSERVDLRMGTDADGEIILIVKNDSMLYRLMADPNYQPNHWRGYEISASGWVDTGATMGELYVREDPWIYSARSQSWVYIPAAGSGAEGFWFFQFR
jgi:glucose/arabinose dehydrogenase